jgi:hypothetical protein
MRDVAANLNRITGNLPTSETLQELPATASLADVIAALNVIIRRLN